MEKEERARTFAHKLEDRLTMFVQLLAGNGNSIDGFVLRHLGETAGVDHIMDAFVRHAFAQNFGNSADFLCCILH